MEGLYMLIILTEKTFKDNVQGKNLKSLQSNFLLTD